MPAIGQTLSRQLMPQLADSKKFVDHLKKQGIDFTEKDFDTSDLKSTQMDFDNLKVFQMMNSKEKKSPIVVSRDNHILDGHHRWIADHNMSGTTKAFMVNLPILDLIKQAHDYNNQLNEEINHKDFGPMMDSFVSFASERLGIKSLPKLSYKDADKDFTSFGGYNPSEKSIVVVTKNRHPMDIFRTVAHELVHCKQDEDGRIKDVAKEGSTGSDIENEANAVAGQIMRWYAKANPDKFTLTNMVEETSLDEDLRKWFREKWVRYDTKGNIKGPCAREEGEGKPKCRPLASARAMSKKERAKSARRKRRNDPVADRKGKGEKPIFVATEEYLTEKNKPTNPELWARAKSLAKQKFDVYPCVTMDSKAITKDGIKTYNELSVGDEIITYNIEKNILEWDKITHLHFYESAPIKKIYKRTGFCIRATDNHKWVVKSGESYENVSLVETKNINKRMRIITCASLLNDSDVILEDWSKNDNWVSKILSWPYNMREVYLASSIVYDGHDVGGSSKIKGRHTFGFSQKNNDHFWATILAAYLNGYHVSFHEKTDHISGASIIRNKPYHSTQNLIIEDDGIEDVWCPTTKNQTWVMIQNGFITITGNSAYANGWASKWYKSKGGGWKSVNESFDDFLKENKPSDREWGTDSLTRIYADSTPGQTFPVNPLFEVKKKKFVRKKKLEEDGLLGSTLDMYNTPYTLPSNDGIGPEYGNRYSGISGFGAGVQSSTGTGYSYPFGTLAEKCGATYKKHLSELKDAPMGTVPKQGTDPELSEESPAWQRKEGKDPKGGLNKKGVASYRRENPGSKLQTAVTTEPSKLKKGSKKAKRRLSFCRRMKGMKKRLTSAKTARDPDSRINKALRKWNCE